MINGPTISGISTTIISVSIGLVQTSITSEPSSVSVERSVIEMPTPEIDCTSVVSAVSRDSTSPVRVTSKNVGSMRTTFAYTALRTSATTRSPSHVTR